MTKILILGGIREAIELAEKFVSSGHDVTTSLAGRTKEPRPIAGKTRIGGFGGVDGLANYLTEEKIERLIDCTHPFAKQISENAKQAAQLAGVTFEAIKREPWQAKHNDQWIKVESLEAARDAIPKNARVLLALGRQYIDLFKTRDDVHFTIRMVDAPETDITLPQYDLILGRPSTNPQDEKCLLNTNNITHIVCRNSGGLGAYAKIEAARELGLPVIIVKQS